MTRVILSSQAAFNLLENRFHQHQEEVWLLGLSSTLNLLTCCLVFRGTADACLVHPRDLFRILFQHNCTQFIIAHNHPSGDPRPSPKDLKLTQRLVKVGRLLEVVLLDHLILAGKKYYSFADAGKISGRQGLAQDRYRHLSLD